MGSKADKVIAKYNKVASDRKARAGELAKETMSEYKLRGGNWLTNNIDNYGLAAASTAVDRSRVGTGSTAKGEFLTGPLKTDEQRNLSRAKNAKMKAIQAAKAKAGKKK
jgi:hypothetical protein